MSSTGHACPKLPIPRFDDLWVPSSFDSWASWNGWSPSRPSQPFISIPVIVLNDLPNRPDGRQIFVGAHGVDIVQRGRVEGKPLELFFTTKIVNYKQYCIPGVTAEIGDAIKDLKNVGVWYISHLHLAHLAGLCKSWVDLGGLNQILNPIVTTISDILFLLEKIDMAFGILYADIELGWASPDYTP